MQQTDKKEGKEKELGHFFNFIVEVISSSSICDVSIVISNPSSFIISLPASGTSSKYSFKSSLTPVFNYFSILF